MPDDAPPAEPTAPPPKRSLVSAGGLIDCAVVLSLACTWLGSLGRHGWALDLLSHFRLQYLLACAVALLYALLRRRTWLAVAAFVSLLWNAQLIHAVHQTAEAPAAPTGKPLRLMTWNVLTDNPRQRDVLEHALAADADILCLVEVDDTWHKSLEPLRTRYPHRVEVLNEGNFGIACYTRLPLKSSEVRRFTRWRLPVVLLNLDHLGRPLTFIGMHPEPPVGGTNANEWQQQLSGIATLVAGLSSEVIVAGDFNATPWCEGMRLLREKGGLEFRSVDPVWPPTWGRHLPMMIPIDHVLVKPGLIIQKRTLGPELGSDHCPVLVEIVRATP